ncbi:Hpt domain-containing protein [Candidatus Pantoea bituminis]|uniref:Hpt domain-containing protein n=1 Tax=Candidatus Pantoea bituminis TaxID=2831036 RepID=UPI001C060D3D|nr:Hpt domain-containing protein [Pantoea bituminis]
MMLQSIQTSHATLLKAIQQSTDRDTLSELGHKLKGGAQILNATVLEQLGRELENNRTNEVALAPLIEKITNEIKNIDQQLINSQG